ncbi:MAG: biopolymer transporter ExbD [bacterium]|nr:MAG: biopolymer transporter ExbD [bacterium]
MNLKQAIGKDKRHKDVDVNVIPVMNIFLLLIPFLLLTAAFVRLAVVELSLPSLNKGQSDQVQRPKNLVLVILAIKETGFQLKAQGFKFDPLYNKNNQYDYQKLVEQLKQIKQEHPHAEDIFISPENKVKYDIIIKAMDRCRETGFPNVSLSG